MRKIFFIFFTLSLVIILSGMSTAQYDGEYERALQSYNSGNYEEAVRLFKDYVKKKPDASAYYRIGYALYKLGRQDEARKYYDKAYRINPDFSPMQSGAAPAGGVKPRYDSEYERALQSYNSGNYEEAVRLFKDYVKKKPDASAYYRIGYALYKLGRQDEARKYYDEAYLISPDFSLVQSEEPSVEMGRPGTPRMLGATAEEPIMLGVTREEPEMQVLKKQPLKEIQSWVPQGSAVTPEEPVVQKEEFVPEKRPETKPGIVEMPPLLEKKPVPFEIPQVPSGLAALIAGFGIFAVLVEIAIFIYVLLCLYLIAKKLNVPAAWLAWIPIVNIWVVIKSAGLKWWWILVLIFVPIPIMFLAFLGPAMFILVFILITALYTYPWMLISENLGRNRLLGLLIIPPVLNFIFLGVLAFSKSESESEHLDLTVNE